MLRCIDQTIEEAALTDRAEPVTLEFERRRRMVKPTNVRYEVTREQIRYVDLKRSVQADGPIARLQSLALDDAKIPSKVAVAIETNGVRDIPKRLVGDVAPLEVWNLRRLLREIRPDLNPRPQPNLGPR